MSESCHTHECVMSHIWMSRITHMNESCAMTIHVCAMTHSCMCHDSYEWVIYDSHILMSHDTHMNEYDIPDSFMYVTRLIHIDSHTKTHVPSRLSEWVTSHWRMSHVTHTNESHCAHIPSRLSEGVTSHIRMSHVAHMYESRRTYVWVTSHIRMSHVALTNESHRT